MAEYQITYWRDIPSMVTAREGRRNKATKELAKRFMVAIDEAAMRAGLTDPDAYLEEWHKGDWQDRDGTPEEVAEAVAAEVEEEFSPAKVREILDAIKSA